MAEWYCDHPGCTPDDPCLRHKVMSLSIGAGALPNRKPGVTRMDAKDRALAGDLDAYKRLRHDGLQPHHIDGSAELEKRVESQFDVDLGRYVPKAEESRVREGMAVAREMGMTKA